MIFNTIQDLADFAAEEVRIGHGRWAPNLCPRGLNGIQTLPENSYLAIGTTPDHEIHDEKQMVVRLAARLKEKD